MKYLLLSFFKKAFLFFLIHFVVELGDKKLKLKYVKNGIYWPNVQRMKREVMLWSLNQRNIKI